MLVAKFPKKCAKQKRGDKQQTVNTLHKQQDRDDHLD